MAQFHAQRESGRRLFGALGELVNVNPYYCVAEGKGVGLPKAAIYLDL